MNHEQEEYIRYRRKRALQSLQAAKNNLENGLLHEAVSRSYYACFYAVTALLVTRDLYSSKHRGVRAFFDEHFVKKGLFSREMSRFYHRLFDSRQESDYKDLVIFAHEDVEAWLAQAEDFVAAIGKFIDDERKASTQE